MEYCFHVWTGTPNFCLDMLKKLQEQVRWAASPALATSLEPLAYSRHLASQILSYKYYFERGLSELAELVSLPYPRRRPFLYLVDGLTFL